MSKKANKHDRFVIIEGLFTLLKYANAEGYWMDSLYEGIPDGDSPKDFLDEICDDDDEFEGWLNLYLRLCAQASQDGGFYGLLHNGNSTADIEEERMKPFYKED